MSNGQVLIFVAGVATRVAVALVLLFDDRQWSGAPLHWSVWTRQRCRFVTPAGNVRLVPLFSVDGHIWAITQTYDFRFRDVVWGAWKCRNRRHQPICRTRLRE